MTKYSAKRVQKVIAKKENIKWTENKEREKHQAAQKNIQLLQKKSSLSPVGKPGSK